MATELPTTFDTLLGFDNPVYSLHVSYQEPKNNGTDSSDRNVAGSPGIEHAFTQAQLTERVAQIEIVSGRPARCSSPVKTFARKGSSVQPGIEQRDGASEAGALAAITIIKPNPTTRVTVFSNSYFGVRLIRADSDFPCRVCYLRRSQHP